jgi:hypothetical protein
MVEKEVSRQVVETKTVKEVLIELSRSELLDVLEKHILETTGKKAAFVGWDLEFNHEYGYNPTSRTTSVEKVTFRIIP